MSDKSRKAIIITIIILIIVIIGVIIMIKKINNEFKSDVIEYDGIVLVNNELEKVTSRSNYYIVKNIVEKYFYSLNSLNKTSDDVLIFEYDEEVENLENEIATEIEGTKNKIYNYFDEKYIQEMEIDTNNLQEKLGNYNDLYVLIEDMYVRDVSGFLRVYFVFGSVIEKENLEAEEFKLMVAIDEKNKTFNIYTSDYIKKHNLYELSKKKSFDLGFEEIENRKYNTYKYEYISDETYATDLLSNYTQGIKYLGTEHSYNKLDDEYKVKRFKDISGYKEYVEENNKEITTALLEYYQSKKYNDYTQYICIDRQGNYYIFKETAIMDYDLILDTYTIDLPEFIEKYEKATTEEKVMLNIQKIVEALNEKDYNYVYSKIADEFKANNFKTYEDFEKYAEKTFDIGYEVKYNQYTESENLSTYKITLIGENETITKTIVMRLEEGTNFVMSFNIE